MEALGFLELNSIAKGIEAADSMIKAAEVRLVSTKPVCPGKYIVLISGDVAAVTEATEIGSKVGAGNVIDMVILPRVHHRVLQALQMPNMPEKLEALGILEFMSIVASVEAADAAAKAADIDFIDLRLGIGIGGKSFIAITGDVAAVNEALESGAQAGSKGGMLISKVVIANPSRGLYEALI